MTGGPGRRRHLQALPPPGSVWDFLQLAVLAFAAAGQPTRVGAVQHLRLGGGRRGDASVRSGWVGDGGAVAVTEIGNGELL